MTVHPELPPHGLDAVRTGQIYERSAFTAEQFAEARRRWTIQVGTIQDPGKRHGTRLVKIGPPHLSPAQPSPNE